MTEHIQKGLQYLALAVVLASIIVSVALVSSANTVSTSLAGAVVAAPVATATPSGNLATATPRATATPTAELDLSAAPLQGSVDAKVTLVEFSDFQCPFCRRFYNDAYQNIKQDYVDTGKINHAWMNFPLDSIHPAARPAAYVAMCAGEQGKFWEAHEKIFDEQNTLEPSGNTVSFTQADAIEWVGTIAGIDKAALETCANNATPDDQIQSDLQQGIANGITGTPGFLLIGPNGERKLISGAQPYAVFKSAIDAYLAA
ncbi:hypothetical protein AUJ14_03270 [Candidatus Micrarchaeota archaeon CG1_02_55_22]|nr:MAG: hypothetical protein AUJ14_03270 [Candidatus Micrarchaeota archaeon CG1_02_55_22]